MNASLLADRLRDRQRELASAASAERKATLVNEWVGELRALPRGECRRLIVEALERFPESPEGGTEREAPSATPVAAPVARELGFEEMLAQFESRLAGQPKAEIHHILEGLAQRLGLPPASSHVSGSDLLRSIREAGRLRGSEQDPLQRSDTRQSVEDMLASDIARACGDLEAQDLPVSSVVELAAGLLLELALIDWFAKKNLEGHNRLYDDPVHGWMAETDYRQVKQLLRTFVTENDLSRRHQSIKRSFACHKAVFREMRHLIFDNVVTDHVFRVTPEVVKNPLPRSRFGGDDYEELWRRWIKRFDEHFGKDPDRKRKFSNFLSDTLEGRVRSTLADKYGWRVKVVDRGEEEEGA